MFGGSFFQVSAKYINLPAGNNLNHQEDKPNFSQQKELDEKLVYSLNKSKLPNFRQLKHLFKILKPGEKKIFGIAFGLIALSIIFLAGAFYFRNFLPVPKAGGQYVEGLIGAPQYINPILSQTNDVDTDIARLVFSGLMKYDHDLQVVPDMAADWQVSEDQKEYIFNLKPGLFWHDDQTDAPQPVTSDDIIFTLKSIQDPDFKSPLLISLRGVEVEKLDDQTVKFILPEPYPAFLEVMTFGILPEHIWGEIPPINANLTEYNLKPVGSGPWKFKSLFKDKLGNIKSYTLLPNPDYQGLAPYLEQITFKFYPDFQTAIEALKNNSIEGISFLPKELKKELSGQKNAKQYSFDLPQYTAIFFNQKENEALKNKSVRQALALAINKPEILSQALQLEGQIIDGPILPGTINGPTEAEKINFDPDKADQLLTESGWAKITWENYREFLKEQVEKAIAAQAQKTEADNTDNQAAAAQPANEADQTKAEDKTPETNKPGVAEQNFYRRQGDQILEIILTTVNQPENVTAAELTKKFWQNIGVKVNLQIIEPGKIRRDVIKPRNYQALLFGIIVGSDPDPYPFWHSSQIQDPGLNLSLYANRNVDKLLEDARKTADQEERLKKYQEFQTILNSELPAIFLYNPTYTYVVDQKIKDLNIQRITMPADRFNNLSDWYIKTRRVYQGGLR
ncbi:MAG: hypothetical protein A3A24_00295 [Candidatus Buchananbacteria bacterium RIFCSPLOWO2_01_FULL_46_12]|uniref:Solute-binding protein family 5 domain-containing protein n=2 Tax=Candidatus Buchananiibacteriota TaxID=1817903 RepID=A0A1G1YM89_9BACT|nr:MAG: hypothetical protein A2744_00680 [Candidatus Buchananbacteria bacterium RIFCSPHIGHO2_01_FULL_44_11]OGY53401.1 MAG: hypothetical protein A3A24_00295 [Candidatus Buchananbacteria bacterium RIFCSPLOWO2_01_FULL_46_12]